MLNIACITCIGTIYHFDKSFRLYFTLIQCPYCIETRRVSGNKTIRSPDQSKISLTAQLYKVSATKSKT